MAKAPKIAPGKAPTPAFRTRTITISEEIDRKARGVVLELSDTGVQTSVSGLMEIGLRELLSRRDLAATVRRHGASGRRKT